MITKVWIGGMMIHMRKLFLLLFFPSPYLNCISIHIQFDTFFRGVNVCRLVIGTASTANHETCRTRICLKFVEFEYEIIIKREWWCLNWMLKWINLPFAWVFGRLRVPHAMTFHRMVVGRDAHDLCGLFRFWCDSWLLLASHWRDSQRRAHQHCVANLIQSAIQVVSPMPVMSHLWSDELSNADVWDVRVPQHLYHPTNTK